MTTAAIGAYRAVQATTADRGRLLLLLLDGGLAFLDRARQALEQGDTSAFGEAVRRAHAVVAELAGTLDHAAGGEVAANLGRLYDFMLVHLTQGLVGRSRTHVEQVRALLATVRAGFEGAVERTAGGA